MNVSDFYTSGGIADVTSNSEIWRFSYKMPEFIMNYTGIHKNIQEVSKVFVDQSEEIAKTVFQLGKYYEVLGAMYKDMNVKNMYQIHKFMSDIFTCWGNTFLEQGQVMKSKFGKFYTYHTYEGEPLREMIKKRFSVKENYVKAEVKLNDKKNRLLKSQDYKKWELDREGLNKLSQLQKNEEMAKKFMLPNDTKVVEEKRHLLNYMSNQVNYQVRDMFNNNYTDLSEHLMEVAFEQKEAVTKSVANWNNLIDHFKGMNWNQYDDEPEIREEKKEELTEEQPIKKAQTMKPGLSDDKNKLEIQENDADNELEEEKGNSLTKHELFL